MSFRLRSASRIFHAAPCQSGCQKAIDENATAYTPNAGGLELRQAVQLYMKKKLTWIMKLKLKSSSQPGQAKRLTRLCGRFYLRAMKLFSPDRYIRATNRSSACRAPFRSMWIRRHTDLSWRRGSLKNRWHQNKMRHSSLSVKSDRSDIVWGRAAKHRSRPEGQKCFCPVWWNLQRINLWQTALFDRVLFERPDDRHQRPVKITQHDGLENRFHFRTERNCQAHLKSSPIQCDMRVFNLSESGSWSGDKRCWWCAYYERTV